MKGVTGTLCGLPGEDNQVYGSKTQKQKHRAAVGPVIRDKGLPIFTSFSCWEGRETDRNPHTCETG